MADSTWRFHETPYQPIPAPADGVLSSFFFFLVISAQEFSDNTLFSLLISGDSASLISSDAAPETRRKPFEKGSAKLLPAVTNPRYHLLARSQIHYNT